MTGKSEPAAATMRSALVVACRAPSLHNIQPWRWVIGPRSVHLFLDRSRVPPVLDPTGEQSVIGCGAALHQARIGFAAEGWRTLVHRLPNPDQPDHLASIEFSRLADIDAEAVVLAGLAARRRTDRRPFLPDPVPPELMSELREAAATKGCVLDFVLSEPARQQLSHALRQAGRAREDDPEYRHELAKWSTRHASSEGVPARSIPEAHAPSAFERDFGAGELPIPVLDDGAELALLYTLDDTLESELLSGEVLGETALYVAREGLAGCVLSQFAEVFSAREFVREQVLGGAGVPRFALRLGWPVTERFPAPPTPRRPLAECVENLFPNH
ncbi:Nitroreductase family protein [Actinopolyspora mzabensis]|uniref:Nitroreductase family protein n=1 Tax=Actinopolyspora mzabensis TaxID=995066 RepID=A0A1G9EKQ0_ACTMZ|nr:nitroreductase family protein [Actinopolyspora mzabensis]SDK76724.1 Nitroreductase family protein [Actinopolyspora mzabensis]